MSFRNCPGFTAGATAVENAADNEILGGELKWMIVVGMYHIVAQIYPKKQC